MEQEYIEIITLLKEWVLNGDTVIYAPFDTIKETLEYDFEQERNFLYKGLRLRRIYKTSMQIYIKYLASTSIL